MITVNPKVMMGKPVIAGTRITVEHLLRELAAGTTIDQLLEMHIHITRENIQAALDYAAPYKIDYSTNMRNYMVGSFVIRTPLSETPRTSRSIEIRMFGRQKQPGPPFE